uniref:HECT domain-containing protein n=1 Tax=Clytia hemisphaerica TaxID=252671 RepID=A0A7M5XKK5_9CNID
KFQSLINLHIHFAAPDPDFPNLNQRLEQLKVLFPKGNERNVARAAFDSITTDQAVEKYLQLNEIEEKKSGSEAASGSRNEIEETNFERFDDMLDHYRNKYLTEEKTCSLNVQREELWRVAQAFYKKAINDPEILFRKFEVNFSKDTGEEESVDAGALKIEFFELLLVELKNRCLEGDEFSLIPRKSDSVNFIILGLAIAHSVLHGGPGFYQFQAWVYQILVGNDDPENLMTFIDKKLIVKSASSVNLLKFIDQLQAANTKSELDEVVDKFIEIINCSRWESSTEITLKNKGVLLAQLVYDELIYRRQTPIQSIREGLKITGLLPVMIRNQQLCEPIFSYNAKIDAPTLKAILVNNDVNKDDFEKQQAFNFFNKLLDDDEMPPQFLKAVLKFSTGFHNIPPWGMKKKIMIRYLADDESKIYPESMSCFNIFYLPTVHSDFQKFKNDMLKAFEIEGIGFSSSS